MIKRTTDYLNYGGQGEEDFQAVLHVVGSAIERVPSRKTKKGLVEAYKAKDLFVFLYVLEQGNGFFAFPSLYLLIVLALFFKILLNSFTLYRFTKDYIELKEVFLYQQ